MEVAGPAPELQQDESRALNSDPFLKEFQRLGEQIFLYRPQSRNPGDSDTKTPAGPDLLLMCSWMGASSKNVKKYISTYQTIFPHTPILLLKQDGNDLFWRTHAVQLRNLQPALAVVKALVDEHEAHQPRVLLHIFSNGGTFSACMLSGAYYSAFNELLPISALILDSTPAHGNPKMSHDAISELVPGSGPLALLKWAGVWLFMLTTTAWRLVRGIEEISDWGWRKLNDPKGAFVRDRLKRVYIYSDADRLIPPTEVELHAAEAKEVLGKDRVQLENFGASRHVGHVIADPERYWKVVRDLWAETTVAKE